MSTAISGWMPMYLEASPAPASGFCNLYIYGSHSGSTELSNSIPLFLTGSSFTSSMNLFLNGISAPGSIETEMNLFLEGFIPSISSGINLYICGNNQTPMSLYSLSLSQLYNLSLGQLYDLAFGDSTFLVDSLPMFIQGAGENPGWNVENSSMNLYLYNAGVSSGVNLFLHGNCSILGNIPLYLHGCQGISSGTVNLYLNGVNYIQSQNLPLFLRGYSTIISDI